MAGQNSNLYRKYSAFVKLAMELYDVSRLS
jgi:hypothetical protein